VLPAKHHVELPDLAVQFLHVAGQLSDLAGNVAGRLRDGRVEICFRHQAEVAGDVVLEGEGYVEGGAGDGQDGYQQDDLHGPSLS